MIRTRPFELCMAVLCVCVIGTTVLFHYTQQSRIAYFKGHALFETGDYRGAIPFYELALSLDPRSVSALTDLAYACQWSGDHDKARASFERLRALVPDAAHVLRALGDLAVTGGNYDDAVAWYERYLAKEPSSFDVQLRLAEIALWQKQYPEAASRAQQCLALRPQDVGALLVYGQALQYQGNTDAAIAIYQDILRRKTASNSTREGV